MCSEETSNEHPAKVMTFMVVFASVFCGWPCLLHCMAGFAKTGRGKVWAEKRIATSRRGRNADLHCRLCFDVSLLSGGGGWGGAHCPIVIALFKGTFNKIFF